MSSSIYETSDDDSDDRYTLPINFQEPEVEMYILREVMQKGKKKLFTLNMTDWIWFF